MVAPAIRQAKETLFMQATPWIARQADRLVESGVARWEIDPVVDDVVGLLEGDTNNALIVVYLESGDFEVADRFYEMYEAERGQNDG